MTSSVTLVLKKFENDNLNILRELWKFLYVFRRVGPKFETTKCRMTNTSENI